MKKGHWLASSGALKQLSRDTGTSRENGVLNTLHYEKLDLPKKKSIAKGKKAFVGGLVSSER